MRGFPEVIVDFSLKNMFKVISLSLVTPILSVDLLVFQVFCLICVFNVFIYFSSK